MATGKYRQGPDRPNSGALGHQISRWACALGHGQRVRPTFPSDDPASARRVAGARSIVRCGWSCCLPGELPRTDHAGTQSLDNARRSGIDARTNHQDLVADLESGLAGAGFDVDRGRIWSPRLRLLDPRRLADVCLAWAGSRPSTLAHRIAAPGACRLASSAWAHGLAAAGWVACPAPCPAGPGSGHVLWPRPPRPRTPSAEPQARSRPGGFDPGDRSVLLGPSGALCLRLLGHISLSLCGVQPLRTSRPVCGSGRECVDFALVSATLAPRARQRGAAARAFRPERS